LSLKPYTYAAALLLVHLLGGCSGEEMTNSTNGERMSPAPTPSATTTDGKLVLAFGDSLYAGYGVLPQESFPYELQRALAARGVTATVRNAGVSGDTTAAGLARLVFTLDGLDRKPDLALVGLGGNDMLRGIDPEVTRANLTAILTELRRRDIDVILTGMIAAPNMGRAYTDRFNAIYPDLAKQFGAGLYPFFLDGVVLDRTLMLPDRVHPNPKGIDVVVQKVVPMVAERLAAAEGAAER
jgi:acyl-CoA thioesterase I